jgi:hypothetical protein
MHDYITGIDQHPVRVRQTLDAGLDANAAKVLDHTVGDGRDMAVRPAAGYDHVIANAGFTVEVDGDDVLGFHFIKLSEDDLQCLLSGRDTGAWLRDTFGCASDGNPRDKQCVQGPFLSFAGLAGTRPDSYNYSMRCRFMESTRQHHQYKHALCQFHDSRNARNAVDDSGDFSPCRNTQAGGRR